LGALGSTSPSSLLPFGDAHIQSVLKAFIVSPHLILDDTSRAGESAAVSNRFRRAQRMQVSYFG
jgi:hypothetical protein